MPSCCIDCSKFDYDVHRCTTPDGKLSGITLTDSLSEARHDCPAFEEVRYRLTPAAILSTTLEEHGCDLPFDEVQALFDEFMARMELAGYVAKNDND